MLGIRFHSQDAAVSDRWKPKGFNQREKSAKDLKHISFLRFGNSRTLRIFLKERAAQGDPLVCFASRRFASEPIQPLSGGSPVPPAPPRSRFSPLPKERLNAATVTRGPARVICDLVQGHQYYLKKGEEWMDTEIFHGDNRGKPHRGKSTLHTLMGRREI